MAAAAASSHADGTDAASEATSDVELSGAMSHCCLSKESDEVGYLLLEGCDAHVLASSADDCGSVAVPSRTWIPVEWESLGSSILDSKLPPTMGETDERQDGEPGEGKVCGCSLVLHAETCTSSPNDCGTHDMKLVLKKPPLFNGNMSDMASCGSPSCTHATNRSDAALLVGVAFTCQFYGYLVIRSMKIMKMEDGRNEDGTERIALLITFAMPQLTDPDQPEDTARSIVPAHSVSKKKASTTTKPLPPSVQLLLSIVRSDWDFLEKQMEQLRQAPRDGNRSSMFQMEHDGTLTKTKRTMFPKKLTLEELYLRLRGVTATDDESGVSSETSQSPSLVSVPQDILVTSIAPFLRARCLDSLRTSCKSLHRSLRAVVPGMKLHLYKHQTRSLEWMRRREAEQLSEEGVLDFDARVHGAESVGGDMHRAATGGASACLRLHPNSRATRKDYRINQQTGREITHDTTTKGHFALSRRVARGGLLCDDPGLGKTITVLSLILQTSGLSTEAVDTTAEEENTSVHSDEDIFQAYWREHVPQIFRVQSFHKLLGRLRRYGAPATSMFEFPVHPTRDKCPEYFDVIKRPMCFKDIDKAVKTQDYGSNFEQFREDVDLCFQNAMTYNRPGHPVHEAAAELSTMFAGMVNEFKATQVQSAKKSFSRASAKPNSSVAALLEKRNYNELLSSLKRTAATLLVVPGTLLNHWEEQIRLHVDLTYVSDKIPLIYHYNGNEVQHAEAVDLCQIQKTHFPCVFIDKAGTKPLPSANFMKMFRIVLTTTQRFANEWKHGSFQEELKRNGGEKESSSIPYEIGASPYRSRSACSLLKIHWFRLIVDEGHSMGRGGNNNAILFASWIMAERRWAMTGTPTPQTVSHSGLNNLRGLMRFLQHEFFSARLDGERVWQGSIVREWNSGELASFFRLRQLLSLLMVRHTKLDIEELEPPTFHRTFTSISAAEMKAYNTLACGIQSNLLITSMAGKTSGRQDSILARANTKTARTAFINLRLVCAGRSDVVPIIEKQHLFGETIEMVEALGVEGVRLKVVENFMHRAVTDQLSGCQLCGVQLSTLLIIPCGHLICTECMDNKTSSCPVCDEPFDIDTFQRVQPGFVVSWHATRDKQRRKREASTDQVRNGEESNPPQAIELFDRVALQPPPARRRTRKFGDGHKCEYDVASTGGECTLCFEEHFECVMVNSSRCSVCYKTPEMCPQEESKSCYLSTKLAELHAEYSRRGGQHFDLASSRIVESRPLKAIIFSEFRRTLNLVGHRLLGRFGGGCVAEFWGKSRNVELAKFAKSPDCFCMLLGKDGSEGLDLSFVTHIFFLEEVWDKALENQAISRAWRMGAKGSVEVETIVARNTVEETMIGVEQALTSSSDSSKAPGNSGRTSELASAKEYQRAKLLFLLKNLKLIRPQARRPPTAGNLKRGRVAIEGRAKTTGDDEEVPRKRSKVTFGV